MRHAEEAGNLPIFDSHILNIFLSVMAEISACLGGKFIMHRPAVLEFK